jgi:hypothetical protein
LWTPEELGVAAARASRIGFAKAPTMVADTMIQEESFILRSELIIREASR